MLHLKEQSAYLYFAVQVKSCLHFRYRKLVIHPHDLLPFLEAKQLGKSTSLYPGQCPARRGPWEASTVPICSFVQGRLEKEVWVWEWFVCVSELGTAESCLLKKRSMINLPCRNILTLKSWSWRIGNMERDIESRPIPDSWDRFFFMS